jgi:hypothetical protein
LAIPGKTVIARIRSFQSAARVSINGQDFTTGETELTPPARTFRRRRFGHRILGLPHYAVRRQKVPVTETKTGHQRWQS